MKTPRHRYASKFFRHWASILFTVTILAVMLVHLIELSHYTSYASIIYTVVLLLIPVSLIMLVYKNKGLIFQFLQSLKASLVSEIEHKNYISLTLIGFVFALEGYLLINIGNITFFEGFVILSLILLIFIYPVNRFLYDFTTRKLKIINVIGPRFRFFMMVVFSAIFLIFLISYADAVFFLYHDFFGYVYFGMALVTFMLYYTREIKNLTNMKMLRFGKRLEDTPHKKQIYEVIQEIRQIIPIPNNLQIFISESFREALSFLVDGAPLIILPAILNHTQMKNKFLKTIILHELIHIHLDANHLINEIRRAIETRAMWISFLWFILFLPVFITYKAIQTYNPLLYIQFAYTRLIHNETFIELTVFSILVVVAYVFISIVTTPEVLIIKFREARAHFITAMLTQNPIDVLATYLFLFSGQQSSEQKATRLMNNLLHNSREGKSLLNVFIKNIRYSLRSVIFGSFRSNLTLHGLVATLAVAKLLLENKICLNLPYNQSKNINKFIHDIGAGDYETSKEVIQGLLCNDSTTERKLKLDEYKKIEYSATLFHLLFNCVRKKHFVKLIMLK